MNKYLTAMLARYMDQANDGTTGSTGGAAATDRGDMLADGAPKIDDLAAIDAEAEAERIRAEEAAKAGGTADAGAASADPETEAGKAAMIPVERHKAVLEKARAERDAAVAEVAKYRQGQQVVQTNADITKLEEQVSGKEVEYNKLLVEGEVEKATAVMRDIRKLEREMGDMKAEMRAQAASVQAIETVRYNTIVERLEAAYPALNPDSDDFDKERVAEVMELKDALQLKGRTPSDALQRAVKLIMGAETSTQKTAVDVTPRVDKAAATGAARKEEATTKAVDAATRTPPQAAKVGMDSDKHGAGAITAEAIMKMNQDQFRKLDEKTLAQLRGDEV